MNRRSFLKSAAAVESAPLLRPSLAAAALPPAKITRNGAKPKSSSFTLAGSRVADRPRFLEGEPF
jgi:hypothetical protein